MTSVQLDPSHTSVSFLAPGPPPKAKAFSFVPAPPALILAVFKAVAVAQAPTGAPAPVHESVAVDKPGASPPKAKPVVEPPQVVPASALLPALKSPCSVQLVPLQTSVTPVVPGGPKSPPKAKASV